MKKFLICGLFFSLLILPGCSLKRTEKLKSSNQVNQPGSQAENARQVKQNQDLPLPVNNESRLVIKDSFSLEAPANWKESPSLPGVSLMMINSTENSDRPEVKKINFRSYFSVTYATLDGKTLDEYTTDIKNQLIQMSADTTFQDLEPIIIDSRPANVFIADINQQGVNFKILMFVATGKDKDVWVMPFNTLTESLAEYQSLFMKIATSFKAK